MATHQFTATAEWFSTALQTKIIKMQSKEPIVKGDTVIIYAPSDTISLNGNKILATVEKVGDIAAYLGTGGTLVKLRDVVVLPLAHPKNANIEGE